MLKTKKTILGVVLGILMALCLSVGITGLSNSKTAYAEETTISGICGGTTWKYNFENKTFTVSPYADGNREIGWMGDYDKYEDTPWDNCGYDIEDEIEKIIVNEGVIKIGDNAFEDCGAVREISLPSSIREVGNCAFDRVGEGHKDDIQIGTLNLKVVGTDAFKYSNITGKIIMVDGWRRLNKNAFTGSRITSACLSKPYSADFVWQDAAFEDAKYLNDVIIFDDFSYVAGATFSGCTNLKSVEFPSAMNTVYTDAFLNCNAIEKVYCRGSFNGITFYGGNDRISNRYNYSLYENWTPKYLDGNKKICQCEVGKYQNLTSGSVLNGNWWLVRFNTVINHPLEVTEDSTIVLLDNYKLTVNSNIHVHPGKSLYIVSESLDSKNMGSLIVESSSREIYAGIGSGQDEVGAKIFICGGNIDATSGYGGAAIGSGGGFSDTTVTIYNGNIKAKCYYGGAGIGSGVSQSNATVYIYNGNIDAEAGSNNAQDIGAGDGGTATVYDYRSDSEPNGTGTLMSTGSIVIICVVGGVALITAGVFIFLHVKKKKKSE